jgi:hypothetical protein
MYDAAHQRRVLLRVMADPDISPFNFAARAGSPSREGEIIGSLRALSKPGLGRALFTVQKMPPLRPALSAAWPHQRAAGLPPRHCHFAEYWTFSSLPDRGATHPAVEARLALQDPGVALSIVHPKRLESAAPRPWGLRAPPNLALKGVEHP